MMAQATLQYRRTGGHAAGRRRGFSLIEILVVVAVILALIGILVPAMGQFQKHAKLANTNARLHAIATALEQYHTDFGMYPPSVSSNAYGGQTPGRGQAMLAQALMGYMPANVDGAGPSISGDPAFGFRTRQSALGGKIYGPYVANDPKSYKQTIQGVDESFLDPFDQEILYFRSTTFLRTAPVTVTNIFGTAAANAGAGPYSYFVSDDCTQKALADNTFVAITTSPSSAPAGFYKSISGGDSNAASGTVMGGTSFLLISAGPDGIYFTADDVVMSK